MAKESNTVRRTCLYNSLHLKYLFFESHGQIPQWILLKIGHDYAVFLPCLIII